MDSKLGQEYLRNAQNLGYTDTSGKPGFGGPPAGSLWGDRTQTMGLPPGADFSLPAFGPNR
jgi:hypothetical protein